MYTCILYKARVGKHSILALCVHVHVLLCTFTLSFSTSILEVGYSNPPLKSRFISNRKAKES